jgi:hypothetical protein
LCSFSVLFPVYSGWERHQGDGRRLTDMARFCQRAIEGFSE